MDLRVLRYFVTVAEEESIVKAANVLHITQPTLSRQLKELETELGTSLFIRGNRAQSLELTEKGRLLYKRAEELLTLADLTQEEMLRSEETLSGTIRIGCGESPSIRVIAKTAAQMRRAHPEVRFELFSGNAEDVKEKLDRGLVDFGVFIAPTALDRYNILAMPDCDHWGLLVNRHNPLAEKERLSPRDLLGEPLLVSAQQQVAEDFSAWSGISRESLTIAGTYNLLYNASLLVAEGYGSALCIEGIVNTEGTDLRFVPLKPAEGVHLNLAWKKHQPLTHLCSAFLKALEGEIDGTSPRAVPCPGEAVRLGNDRNTTGGTRIEIL